MSTLNVANITDGTTTVGTSYVVNGSAKAWVNFNGTGTVAIRDSFNVGSITDSGAGVYNYNLTSSMATTDYVDFTRGADTTNGFIQMSTVALNTVSAIHIQTRSSGFVIGDSANVIGAVLGDLA